MQEQAATLGSQLVNQATPDGKPVGEVERLASNTSYLHSLISQLESRLSIVSNNRNAQADVPAQKEQLPHITACVDSVAHATHRLESLLDNIVL